MYSLSGDQDVPKNLAASCDGNVGHGEDRP